MTNATTPAPLAPPAANVSKAQRAALAIQAQPPAIPAPLPHDLDAALLPLAPVADALRAPAEPPRLADRREWLTATPTVTQSPAGGAAIIDMGAPPDGLTAVECLLWQSLGVACARASLFLFNWLRTRRYMPSCASAGISADTVAIYKAASPVFLSMFTAVELVVRDSRKNRCEDTLHELANGDLTRTKQVYNAEAGEVVTLVESVPPDTKALALALGADDPARYGGTGKGGGAAAVSIVVNVAPGLAWGERKGGAVVDAEVIEGDGEG